MLLVEHKYAPPRSKHILSACPTPTPVGPLSHFEKSHRVLHATSSVSAVNRTCMIVLPPLRSARRLPRARVGEHTCTRMGLTASHISNKYCVTIYVGPARTRRLGEQHGCLQFILLRNQELAYMRQLLHQFADSEHSRPIFDQLLV